RARVGRVSQRVADAHVLDAGDGDDAAGADLWHRRALEIAEGVELRHLGRFGGAVGRHAQDLLPGADRATLQAADRDLADVAAIFDGGDQQLCGAVRIDLRGGQVLDDG